jgi:ABC-type branched-subunit amino acid transport system ATPase component/ABC-type branched-subunit amino acid transport system permease subunit
LSAGARIGARLLAGRPELLLVVALVVVVALLPDGLPLGIAAIGAVSGAVLAMHAIGIVLLYSRTRMLSFAQFGLGIGSAVLFYVWVLHTQFAVLAEGVCRCLAPDGSGLGDLQHNPDPFRDYLLQTKPWVVVVNALISALLGVLLAADTGRQAFLWIAALFGRAPRIVPTIATLAFAVMLGGAASMMTLRTEEVLGYRPFGWFPYGPQEGTGIEGRPALPEGTFESPYADVVSVELESGARLQLYELLVVAFALLSLAYVVRRFERGRRGLASRATAADAERAATLGVDVVTESKGPWKVAGALSGLAGCLSVGLSQTVPAVGIDMYALTLVLAAVVLARMTSPTWALVYSVLLGVLDAGLFWNLQTVNWFQGGLVVLVGAALLLQRGRASRAERAAESVFTTAAEPLPVPRALRAAPGVHGLLRGTTVLVVAALVGYPVISSPGQLSLGISVVGLMVLGLSLLVVSGWAGQVSLGQLALGAVGAWVTTLAGAGWGLPLPLALLLGALAGAVVSPLVGLPAIRLPGPFVAIMTLAFALAVPAVLLNADLLGEVVPATLDRPVLLGLDLGSDRYYYWLSLLVLAGALAVVAGLRRSRLRRALVAARDNAQAAAAFGVDVTRLRLEAFAVSGLLAGLGGGMLAYANGGVQADTFSAANSVVLFLIVVIGGLAAVSGPLLGAAAYGLVQLAGAFWLGLLQGLGTVVVLAVRPAGLAGIVFGLRDAAIRVIMHLQGSDLVRLSSRRVPIADRGAQAPVVPVQYRLVGDGYGPVEGTRLRSVEGVASTPAGDVPPLEQQVEEALEGVLETAPPRLSCHRLEVAYGGATAVAGVSLEVAAGEVLAVVGLNGAGKTSLLRALVGLERAAHGTVELDGTDVTTWFPQARAAHGTAFVPGGAAVLSTLTVRENLVVAGGDDASIASVLVRFPALADRLDTAAGNLSGGEQQVLAVAQAVLRQPRVLLVDELSLGLSPEALAEVLRVVEELAAGGTAVVLVEQSISTAMAIADTALFLESGRVRYQGPASALRDHPELFASVAFGAGGAGVAGATGGGSELARARQALQQDREPVLVVEGLTAAYGDVRVVDAVDLEVAAGEVVGVLGPNGAGKTSLFDALSGLLPVSEGTVTLLGEDVTGLAPHSRAGRGLMRSFQSVRLFPSLTVRDCIAVALETRLTTKSAAFAGLWLPPARAEERRVDERVAVLLELLRLEPLADTPVGSLSLGSRRMVDLACQLAARPKVLLLDEPASGLASGETELLGPLVSRISSDLGCAVLIIEHNVSVLASVAHRLVAMHAGAVVAQGAPADVLADPVVRGAYFGAGAAPAADGATELVATT